MSLQTEIQCTVATIAIAWTGSGASAQRYDLVDLGVLPGDEASGAYGLNERGDVVGGSSSSAAIFVDGEVIPLPGFPGEKPSWYANDINDNREAVGFAYKPFLVLATYWDANQTPHDIHPYPYGASSSVAYALNDDRLIIGGYRADIGGAFGLFYDEGRWVNLANVIDKAPDVNSQGMVVGWGGDPDERAFIWYDGQFVELPMPGNAEEATGRAINELGQVAGALTMNDGTVDAVMWDVDGDMTYLGTMHNRQQVTKPYGINNNGEIVGIDFIYQIGEGIPFLWRRNLLTNIHDLFLPSVHSGWRIDGQYASINNAGQIADSAYNADLDLGRAVRLDPVDTGLTLWSFEPNELGRTNELTINHATPGKRVYVIYGFARTDPTPLSQCDDAMIDIKNPKFAGIAIGESDGRAHLQLRVPQKAAGKRVILQAIDASTCEVSPPSWVRFPDQ